MFFQEVITNRVMKRVVTGMWVLSYISTVTIAIPPIGPIFSILIYGTNDHTCGSIMQKQIKQLYLKYPKKKIKQYRAKLNQAILSRLVISTLTKDKNARLGWKTQSYYFKSQQNWKITHVSHMVANRIKQLLQGWQPTCRDNEEDFVNRREQRWTRLQGREELYLRLYNGTLTDRNGDWNGNWDWCTVGSMEKGEDEWQWNNEWQGERIKLLTMDY